MTTYDVAKTARKTGNLTLAQAIEARDALRAEVTRLAVAVAETTGLTVAAVKLTPFPVETEGTPTMQQLIDAMRRLSKVTYWIKSLEAPGE